MALLLFFCLSHSLTYSLSLSLSLSPFLSLFLSLFFFLLSLSLSLFIFQSPDSAVLESKILDAKLKAESAMFGSVSVVHRHHFSSTLQRMSVICSCVPQVHKVLKRFYEILSMPFVIFLFVKLPASLSLSHSPTISL